MLTISIRDLDSAVQQPQAGQTKEDSESMNVLTYEIAPA